MKKNHRNGNHYLVLSLLIVQILSIGVIGMGYSPLKEAEISTSDDIPNETADMGYHSSPYTIPVDRNTPIMSTDDLENEPQSAYYYYNDYSLLVNVESSAVTKGETVTIHFMLNANFTQVAGETISLKIYRGFYRDYYSYYDNYYNYLTVATASLTTDANGQAVYSFSQTSTEGMYTISASSMGVNTYEEFSVGNIGIFCKGSQYYSIDQPYRGSVQLVNISDFSALSSADFSYTLSYYDYSYNNYDGGWQTLLSGSDTVNSDGFAVFNTEKIEEDEDFYFYSLKLTVTSTVGDETATFNTYLYQSWEYYYYSRWGGEQEMNSDHYQYAVTTDKTIYSPGDTVSLRALVMEYSFLNESKTPLINQAVSLTLFNPDELAIYWTTVETNAYGVLITEFPLDKDCDLGSYGFEFSIGGEKYRHNVKVDYYEKPVFRVLIDTDGKEFYPAAKEGLSLTGNSELFEGTIGVEYFFGQGVVDADVRLEIRDVEGSVRKTLTGKTNGEGEFHFSQDLNDLENIKYGFSAYVEVVDSYGRNAVTSKKYTRYNEIYAWGYLTNWAPKPTETLEYYFSVYQLLMNEYYWYDYNPMSNVTVDIKINGIVDYPIYFTSITAKDHIASYTAQTNNYGSGLLEFSVPTLKAGLYNMIEVEISVELEDGRSTTSSNYFRFQKYALEMEITKENLQPGDVCEITASYYDVLTTLPLTGEGRVYIYDSNYQLLSQATVVIHGEETFHVKIPEFASEGTYHIYSYVYSRSNSFYGGFVYHSNSQSFYVGTAQKIALTSNGTVNTATGEKSNQITVTQGQYLNISGTSDVSSNLPYYFEIYKRGLISSVPITVTEGSFSTSLFISSDYMPDFTIMVYTISDTGKVVEGLLLVHVEYNMELEISTDKDIYEPGDTMTLTITPKAEGSSLLAISFIDSSLLDVEPEDDSELAYFSTRDYWAYIGSGSSWGTGRDAHSYYWLAYDTGDSYSYRGGGQVYAMEESAMADDGAMDMANDVGGDTTQKTSLPTFDQILTDFDTEVRKNISESANWIPSMVITEAVNLTFKLPDNIGEWTIRVVGNSLGMEGGSPAHNVVWGDVLTTQIKTFLPFFIEFDIPQPVVQDDILTVKGYIYNYIGETVEATVAISAPDLQVLNREIQYITIPDGFVSEVEFSVYCTDAFTHNITLLAATNLSGVLYSDAKLMDVYIQPNGIEIRNQTMGFLNASTGELDLDYYLDPTAIYHKESIAFYSDIMEVSVQGWQSLIGYPYGCVEQTMSKLLPTALIFNYLNATDQLTPALEKDMNQMILQGINRIYGFQHTDGGWGWWQDDDSRVIMTAVVVSAMNQITDAGFQINREVLMDAVEFLQQSQKSSGSWEFDNYW